MSLLHRNDTRGAFPPSWYAATTDAPPLRPSLKGAEHADVCVVGAGFTGLMAALTLARAGRRVIVLDAHRAGFGASGRNGGQVGSGFNQSQQWIEKHQGHDAAHALWGMSQAAKDLVRENCAAFAGDALFRDGIAHGDWSAADCRESHADAEYLAKHYGYDQISPLDAAAFQDIVRTKSYVGGTLDVGAGHIHPLRYAVALAREAEAAGALLFDRSEVHHIARGSPAKVQTGQGHVMADHVILAGNGYLSGINKPVNARVMPINSFIAATEPLGDRAAEVLSRDIAVADSKFVVNYFRLSHDGRLLYGGRESYGLGFPTDITTKLRERFEGLFPQIKGAAIDYAWGGTLGITMNRMPCVMRAGPNILSASGFSGHGVALSGFSGQVLAEAIIGQSDRFDILSDLPMPVFPGAGAFRAPLLTLAMTWYAMRDRLGV